MHFDRLIIFHENLAEACTGRALDEGASIEELAEEILFYHSALADDCPPGIQDGQPPYDSQEAVKFHGLVSGLHTLPNILCSSCLQEEAQHVHLEAATLVFVRLEQSVLAVAQVPRLHGTELGLFSLQTSIRRCHELFCLVRGGGVRYRLSQGGENKVQLTNGISYPGMRELYALRIVERRLKEETMAETSEEDHGLIKTKEELKRHVQSLPIQRIREELRVHYDEFAEDFESRFIFGDFNILEVFDSSDFPRLSPHSQQFHALDAAIEMGYSLGDLFSAVEKKSVEGGPRLSLVSAFRDGKFLCTQRSAAERKGERLLSISPRTALALHGFMTKRISTGRKDSSTPTAPPSSNAGHVRHMINLRTFVSGSFGEKAIGSLDESLNHEVARRCRFIEPPPLSTLSSVDQVDEVMVGNAKVWAPKIFLPTSTEADDEAYVRVHIALFQCDEFSFILFMLPPDLYSEVAMGVGGQNDASCLGHGIISSMAPLFQVASEHISSALDTAFQMEGVNPEIIAPAVPSQQDRTKVALPGEIIVLIDRRENVLITMANRSQMHRSVWGWRNRHRQFNAPSRPAVPVRVRDHGQAKPLPPIASFTFGDMMFQCQERMTSYDHKLSVSERLLDYEMCTFRPQGWMYAFAQDEREIYAFFKADKHATMTDVHTAAQCVRQQLLHLNH